MSVETIISQIGVVPLVGWAIVALVLRAFGLWFSARSNQKGWFVIMVLISSGGLIPCIYLLFYKKKR